MPVTVPIPAWNPEGLIPPVDVANPASANRSPYRVSLPDLILRFAKTPERKGILEGFLDYRAALHSAGLVAGFQWIDGSFAEDIEMIEHRAPNDIDLVTFFDLSAGVTPAGFMASNPQLFPAGPDQARDMAALKAKFRVDAYFVNLDSPSGRLVTRGCYWYGMWAHQKKSQRWKGFLEIDLDPVDDGTARRLLPPSSTGGIP